MTDCTLAPLVERGPATRWYLQAIENLAVHQEVHLVVDVTLIV
jgi:hypothetical protein